MLNNKNEKFAWIVVLVWTATTFLFIPFARGVQEFISEIFGRSIFVWTFVTYGCGALALSFSKVKLRLLVILPIALIICAWAWKLRNNPEQIIHFIQYGTLSFLCYVAFSFRTKSNLRYIFSILFCLIAGIIDEVIQWVTPGRIFDIQDIVINGGSAFLVQIGIWFGVKPSE